ncbi:glycosyltransferase [Dyadobacter sediminis]|nr:glycosyltransferase [Dyadobacter sediminis]
MLTKAEMSLSGNLAPVVLFCYNRPWHLRQTIESLQLNLLASQSELIIYSDGPKLPPDEPFIADIRNYIADLKGFKSVKVIAAEKNNGLAKSVIKGVSDVLEKYEKIIVLEDDMLTTPDFLTFMNEALHIYQERKDIFSVTAYSPPIEVPAAYRHDLYLAPRASSWGWGTWKSRWQHADWDVNDFDSLKKDPGKKQAFTQGGEDLWPMLAKQQLGTIDSWAIRWTYSQFKNSAYGVYPVKSKIKNIGTDGSGTNFTFKTGYYESEMSAGKVLFDPLLQPDADVINAFRRYYQLPFYLKIKNRIKYGI